MLKLTLAAAAIVSLYYGVPYAADELSRNAAARRVAAADLTMEEAAHYQGITAACGVSSRYDGMEVQGLAFDYDWHTAGFMPAYYRGATEAADVGCPTAEFSFLRDHGLKFMGWDEYNEYREYNLDYRSNLKNRTDLKITPAAILTPPQ